MITEWRVVEKKNPSAVHCITYSEKRAKLWIMIYGDSGIFKDKTLTKDSFIVVPYCKHKSGN